MRKLKGLPDFNITEGGWLLRVDVYLRYINFNLYYRDDSVQRLTIYNDHFGWKNTDDQGNWWIDKGCHEDWLSTDFDRVFKRNRIERMNDSFDLFIEKERVVKLCFEMFPNFYDRLREGFLGITEESDPNPMPSVVNNSVVLLDDGTMVFDRAHLRHAYNYISIYKPIDDKLVEVWRREK